MSELTTDQREKIVEFLKKWRRSIEYFSYIYSNPPRITQDDLKSDFYERICIHFLNGNDIKKFGENALIKISMFRIAMNLYNKKKDIVLTDFTDNNDDESMVMPSFEEQHLSKEDTNIEIEYALKDKGWKDSWKEILYLYFVKDMNLDEIAEVMGVSHQYISILFKKMLPNFKIKKKNKKSMEYGIDCSLNNVGLSVWENGVLQELHLLRNDKVKYQKKVLKSEILANKIVSIFNFLDSNVFLCADTVYIERPSGSQDSNGMVNYAIEIAVYSYLKNKGLRVEWVKVNDVKKALTNKKDSSKQEMIEAAHYMYPHALNLNYDWLCDKKGRLFNYNEHLADSIAIYLAGKNIYK